jgi:hypothetical protein
MVDPITTAAASGAAGTIAERVIQSMLSGESDDYDDWKMASIDIAIEAQTSFEYRIDNDGHMDRKGAKREMEQFGRQAQKLAVLGKQREFDSEEIDCLEELATVCSDYARSPNMSSGEPESDLREGIKEAVPKLQSTFA